MKAQKLSLYSPIFATMRTELDEKITQAFAAMENSKIGESTITLKISIGVQEEETITPELTLRVAKLPLMAYKIQNSMKAVYAEAGVVDTGRMEIVPDGNGGYELKQLVDEQIGMDIDPEEEENEEHEECINCAE